MKESLLVLGSSMAAGALVERLIAKGATDRFAIGLISPEPSLPFREALFPAVVGGRIPPSALLMATEEHYRSHGVRTVAGAGVVSVDLLRKRVRLGSGGEIAYDRLVLAGGSRPRPVPGGSGRTEGSFSLSGLAELAALDRRAARSSSAVVVGAGPGGIEAAWALRSRGLAVRIVEAAPRVLPAALGPIGASVLAERLARAGIGLSLGAAVTAPEQAREGRRPAVLVEDGSRIEADLVLWATGRIPAVSVAQQAGIATDPGGGGVLVESGQRTSADGVYAMGQCTKAPEGSWRSPLWELDQAEALAAELCDAGAGGGAGQDDLQLNAAGLEVCVLGAAPRRHDVLAQGAYFLNPLRAVYQGLTITDGLIRSAALVGDCGPAPFLRSVMAAGLAVRSDGLDLLARRGAPPAEAGEPGPEREYDTAAAVLRPAASLEEACR